ncbi:hypothetical protein ABEV20_03845 [Bhargavaea massiliensis]
MAKTIEVPSEKLARAVIKHLIPGLIRHLSEQKKEVNNDEKATKRA